MIRKTLLYFQYDWLFIFGSVCLHLSFLQTHHWLYVLLLFLLLIRILSISKHLLYLCICICTIMTVRFHFLQANFSAQHQINYNQPANYYVLLNGRHLEYTDQRITGPAHVKISNGQSLNVQIQFNDIQEDEAEIFLAGVHLLEVDGELEEPLSPRNFGVFDYPKYLKQKGIRFLLKVHNIHRFKPQTQWYYLPDKLVAQLRLFYMMLPSNSLTALMNKFVWNIQSSHYRADLEIYQRLGILHLLSISGFQVYALSRYLRWLFARLGIYVDIIDELIFVCLLTYGYILNWPVGFVRAVGVRGVLLLCHYFKWPTNRTDRLSWVGLASLFVNPLFIDNLGFQLSYLLTYMIGWLRPKSRHGTLSKKEAIILNILCQVISWPILVANYHEINPGQILIFLLIGTFVTKYIMPTLWLLAIVTGVLEPVFWHKIGRWLADLFETALKLFESLTESMPSWVVGEMNPILITVLFIVTLYLTMTYIYKKRKLLIIGSLIYSVIWLLLPYRHVYHRLTVIDIGQGDAILFQPANSRKHYLIDTGGRLIYKPSGVEIDQTFAKKRLIPALKAQGVQSITGLIVTHPDLDHAGNLNGLGQEIPIQQVFVSKNSLTNKTFVEQLQHLNSHINLLEPHSITNIPPFIQLYVPNLSHLDHNAQSIITYLMIQQTTAILMGDATVDTENHLIKAFPHLKADMIKIGHHGSKTSTSELFLQQIDPQLVLNSAGYNNRFGHPHEEVVERIQNLQIPMLSTHQVGAIQVAIYKNGAVTVKSALQP